MQRLQGHRNPQASLLGQTLSVVLFSESFHVPTSVVEVRRQRHGPGSAVSGSVQRSRRRQAAVELRFAVLPSCVK